MGQLLQQILIAALNPAGLLSFVFLAVGLVWIWRGYLPRRRNQIGYTATVMYCLIWSGVVFSGAALLLAIGAGNLRFRVLTQFLTVVSGVMLALRCLDYFRYQWQTPMVDDRIAVIGRGAPFLYDTKSIGQLAGSLILFGTTAIRPLIRFVQQPDPMMLAAGLVTLAWFVACVLLNRVTTWYVTMQGISVWGRPTIEWPEIESAQWIKQADGNYNLLRLTLSTGESIEASIEQNRDQLVQLLRDHIEPDDRQTAQASRSLSEGMEQQEWQPVGAQTRPMAETITYRYTAEQLGEARLRAISRSMRRSRTRLRRVLMTGTLFALLFAVVAPGPRARIVATGISILLVGLIAAISFRRQRTVATSEFLLEQYRAAGADQVIHRLTLYEDGIEFDREGGKPTFVEWQQIKLVVHEDPWIDIYATRHLRGRRTQLILSIRREMVLTGRLDAFLQALARHVRTEYSLGLS